MLITIVSQVITVCTSPYSTDVACPCRAGTFGPTAPTALLIAVLRQIATAATDTRTGLLTHDAWQPAARRALAQSASCALLLIDVDHLKRVNDTHGHLVGDRLIAAVAAQVRDVVGTRGIAGRFGGDEFVALLPNVSDTSAVRHAEELRLHVATLPLPTGSRTRLTVSIGLTLTTPGGDLADALWRADTALYAAKAAGRNTVRFTGTA